MNLSIIVPLYNESESILHFIDELSALYSNSSDTEVIFVNDGSTDNTNLNLSEALVHYPNIKAVFLSKNFGQTAAFQAGIDYSKGDVIITMDGDLQNDPKDIPLLIDKLDDGFDVVSGWRKNRKDNLVRRFLSKIANWLITIIFGLKLHDYGCSIKAYRKEMFNNLYLYGEIHRFIPLVMYWNGALITEIPVSHYPRISGKSKYSIGKGFKVVLDLLTHYFVSNFYTKPNYIFGAFGMIFGLLATIAFGIVAYRVLLLKNVETTPMIFLWLLFSFISLLSFFIGLLAEMVSRLYYSTENRKPYRIHYKSNFD